MIQCILHVAWTRALLSWQVLRGFIHLSSFLPPHHAHITWCCFVPAVPQRPGLKFIGPESCHLTRKTWLTDLVPFPISSSSCVKLTFPASRLYLNRKHQRLMVPWEILLSTLSICLTQFMPAVVRVEACRIFTLLYGKQGHWWQTQLSSLLLGWLLVKHSLELQEEQPRDITLGSIYSAHALQ